MTANQEPLELVTDLVKRATQKGADAADAVFVDGTSLSVAWRNGGQEKLERSEGRDLGLRAIIGKRQAIVSSSDFTSPALEELVDRVIAMAKAVPEDPYCGLAPEEKLAREVPELDGCDPVEPSAEALETRAAQAEKAALSVNGVTNSEGAEAGWSRSRVAIAASNGFARMRESSSHAIAVSVLAGEGTAMERDYDYTTAVYGEDLRDAEELGSAAGEKTVRRLNPRKVETAQVPVIYDPRVANSLLNHLAGAVNGSSVARGTSFLKDKMGERIFADGIVVTDDPLRRRGLRSKPFDGEGVACSALDIIDDGVLRSWILDLRSSRQLGLETTGHAARGTSSPPSPSTTNLYMAPGEQTRDALIASLSKGLYVTELIGMGVNGVAGDYSRGASGFWIEAGVIGDPVSEVTIAGNLKDMFLNVTPANDLEFRYGTNAPTLRIDGMTIAGK